MKQELWHNELLTPILGFKIDNLKKTALLLDAVLTPFKAHRVVSSRSRGGTWGAQWQISSALSSVLAAGFLSRELLRHPD